MRIPKSVTILGRKFVVKNNLSPEQMKKLMGDGSCPLGAMNYSLMTIAIQTHKNKNEQMITFLHECFHAFQYVSGLSLVTSSDLAEVWCETGANAMMDVFKQIK